ncbi:MFS transporter [bacterium]|nr:MFS transporter [bacterium]
MKSKRQNFILFAVGVFCTSFTFGIHFSVFNNFAVERIGLQPQHLGVLESIREVPGLLGALIGGLIARRPETRMAGLSLLLFGAGFIGYSQITTVPLLILCSFVWSVGFHTWYPLADGINLRLADTQERGRRLGQVRSVGAVATLLGIGTVYLLARPLGYSTMYALAGVVGAAGALGLFAMDRDSGHQALDRFILKRRYGLFYALHLLDGCRRQIFGTFAVFTLVRVYHVGVQQVAVLALINSSLSFLFGPYVGRFIDRFGERTALTINYVEMGIVFLGFATLHTSVALCALYVVDSFFFLLSMSLNTYISKIADPGDLRPTLSMAVTMNHIAAVVMPLLGGYLWMTTGYETIFSIGVGLSVVALVTAQGIRVYPRQVAVDRAVSD